MLDEVARWDDLVIGLRPVTYGAKGEPARCLVFVGPTITTKASSEGWRLRLRPNNNNIENSRIYIHIWVIFEIGHLKFKTKIGIWLEYLK
jgi:hypothetical protein